MVWDFISVSNVREIINTELDGLDSIHSNSTISENVQLATASFSA